MAFLNVTKVKASTSELDEIAALIRRACSSKWFERANLPRQLLNFLWDNREGFVTEADIAEVIYDQAWNKDIVSTKVRHLVSETREKLANFSMRDCSQLKWRIVLPPACERGHQLRFVNITNEEGLASALWRGHMNSPRDLAVIVNEPPVYMQRAKYLRDGVAIRLDSAPDQNSLQVKSGSADIDASTVRYPYLFGGEIFARDRIAEWFRDAGLRTRMQVSRNLAEYDIARSSPIFLGDAKANPVTRRLLGLKRYRFLSYRFAPDRSGAIEIVTPDASTEETLTRLVKERPANVEKTDTGFLLTDLPEPEGDVYVLVTRIPNPYGEGAITIIGSGYARALEPVAETLTDESRVRELIETKLLWPTDESFPEAFQWLFSVKMGALSVDGEMLKPELVCWRCY